MDNLHLGNHKNALTYIPPLLWCQQPLCLKKCTSAVYCTDVPSIFVPHFFRYSKMWNHCIYLHPQKTWHLPVKGSNKVHVQDHSCHGRMDVWICLENSIIIIVVIDIFKRVMKCMFRITGTMGTMVKTQQLVLVLSKNIVLKSLMKPDMTEPCFDKDCSQITDEARHETSSGQVLSLKPRSQDGICSFSWTWLKNYLVERSWKVVSLTRDPNRHHHLNSGDSDTSKSQGSIKC